MEEREKLKTPSEGQAPDSCRGDSPPVRGYKPTEMELKAAEASNFSPTCIGSALRAFRTRAGMEQDFVMAVLEDQRWSYKNARKVHERLFIATLLCMQKSDDAFLVSELHELIRRLANEFLLYNFPIVRKIGGIS